MKSVSEAGYNERLFSGGIREQLHTARFLWLRKAVKRTGAKCARVVELGCFDGKALDYIPDPVIYEGFDANWEGGLELAKARLRPGISFHFAAQPDDMQLKGMFDTALSMETLEHIPPGLVSPYLARIAAHLDGYFFATVPVEIGPVFLGKWLAKRVLSRDSKSYTFREVFWATAGRTDHVQRNEHKGFDYRRMVRQIEEHFDVLSVEGCPWRLPPPLCFTVGIVARSKRTE